MEAVSEMGIGGLLPRAVDKAEVWSGNKLVPSGSTRDLEAPDRPLGKIYRKVLPHLGIDKNTKAKWRYLHSTFGSIVFGKTLTDEVITRIDTFVLCFRTPSNLGTKLDMLPKVLQLEMGTNKCPLQMNCKPFRPLATLCWCR